MKMKSLLSMTVATFLFTSASVALAEDKCEFQGNVVSPSQIDKTIEGMGYTVLDKHDKNDKTLKLDDCVYKVKAKDKSDQKWKLYFDPTTGKLIGKKKD